MGAASADEFLAHARELERRDADVAARLDVVVALLRRVDDLEGRAARLTAALAGLPEQVDHAEQAARNARARVTAAQVEFAAAEQALQDVGRRRTREDARAAAERALTRAATAATDAAATVARLEEQLRALAAAERAERAEGEGLVVEAREVATVVAGVPRLSDAGRVVPGEGLEAVEEWGARAHAALFVVRGSLENERERVVLEANALAAAVLGEDGGAASVASVLRWLEQAAGQAASGGEGS